MGTSASVRRATRTVSTSAMPSNRAVDRLLQRDPLAAAQALVGGDHDAAARVDDAVAQRFR